jgi:hypothetical protein
MGLDSEGCVMHAAVEGFIWVVSAILVLAIVLKIRSENRASSRDDANKPSGGSGSGSKSADDAQ